MRDSMPRKTIQQQMYARERRGIFRATEGYDTIAKSGGLDPAFIKKTLHPYCSYDAPAELASLGEKDEALYPDSVHLIHLENGSAVLGRSVFQAADFTGLRSAFFTHNYVIAGDSGPHDYRDWLQAAFSSGHRIEEGDDLPELAELPLEAAGSVQPSARSTLALLGIGEKPFKQLLYAVMTAIGGKKKVYVALDAPIGRLSVQAKQLLKVLYASLPYAYRSRLGFMTYAKEPQSRKGVHLTFVEKGSLRPGDRSIEKEFTFDFAGGRFTNVDMDTAEQPYPDFAWDNLERPRRADDFFAFAEHMLADMGPERLIAASSYHELSVLFQIEEGNDALYVRHKPTVLRSMLDYLQAGGSVDEKLRLNDLFLARFDYEFDLVRQGASPEPYVIDAFIAYYRLDGRYLENKLVSLFVHALNEAGRPGERSGAIAAIYKAIDENAGLGRAFVAKLMTDARLADRLLLPYFEKQFREAAGAGSVLDALERWTDMHPELVGYEPFQALVYDCLTAKLDQERYSLPAVNRALEQLRRLSASKRAGRPNASLLAEWDELTEALELAMYRGLLGKLAIELLSAEQLKQADFLADKDQLRWVHDRLEHVEQQAAARKLVALHQLITLPEPTGEVFDELLPAEIEQVQRAVRRLLENRIEEPAEAARVVLTFLSSKDTGVVDYNGLLAYLHHNSPDNGTMYRFFHWTQTQPLFMRPRGFVPSYAAAIIAYFKQRDREAFKSRANRKQYFSKAENALADVYKQAERELASPLGRLLRGRRGMLFMSIAALGVILIGAGLAWSFADKDAKDGETIVLPPASPDPTPDLRPPVIVYAEQNEASSVEAAATSLVFLFRDAAACTGFAPISLSVQAPGGETADYANLLFVPDCGATAGPGASAEPSATATPSAATEQGEQQLQQTEAGAATDLPANAGNAEEDAADGSLQTEPSGGSLEQPGATQSPLETAAPGLSPTPGASGAEGSLLAFDPADYPGKVSVNLGKLVNVEAGSTITIGATQYVLSSPPSGSGMIP